MPHEPTPEHAPKTPRTTPDPDVPDATDVAVDEVDITEPTDDSGEPVHRNEGGDVGAGAD